MNKIVQQFNFNELVNYWLLNESDSDLQDIPSFEEAQDFVNALEGKYRNIQVSLKNICEWDDEDQFVFLKPYYLDLINEVLSRYAFEVFTSISRYFNPWDLQMVSLDNPVVGEAFYKDFIQLLDYMNRTAPKYSKLLDVYSSAENKLMNRLSTEVYAGASVDGSSRFNDTPQDGGMYADDSHTSNITQTKSTTSSNSATTYDDKNIMQRLDEVQTMYRNIMSQWVDEFEKFFVEVD